MLGAQHLEPLTVCLALRIVDITEESCGPGYWKESVVGGEKEEVSLILAHANILPQHSTSDPRFNFAALTLQSTHTHPSMRVGYMDPKDVWLSYWKDEHKWRELWMCAACPPKTTHLSPTDPVIFLHHMPLSG